MKNNIFQKARIKLTVYYVAIMMAIVALFSSVLIYTIEIKIRQGLKDKITITEIEDSLAKNTSDEIEFIIYIIDGILLVVIGFSSYFLAGRTLKPIKEALDAQEKFSADASHDLRTPLAIITTESEVALQNKDPSVEELRSTVQSNLEESKKMTKLVHDLLLISRGDNRAIVYSYDTVDLHQFLSKLVQKNKHQALDKGLKIDMCEYTELFTTVDVHSFERAILNILQNAIKYTKVGGITVDIRGDTNSIYIVIKDTGVGINSKDLPYIFDRFYRAEHSRSDSSSSGLGLPIAKLIIENHKGNVKVSSIDTGTTVTVVMPRS